MGRTIQSRNVHTHFVRWKNGLIWKSNQTFIAHLWFISTPECVLLL